MKKIVVFLYAFLSLFTYLVIKQIKYVNTVARDYPAVVLNSKVLRVRKKMEKERPKPPSFFSKLKQNRYLKKHMSRKVT